MDLIRSWGAALVAYLVATALATASVTSRIAEGASGELGAVLLLFGPGALLVPLATTLAAGLGYPRSWPGGPTRRAFGVATVPVATVLIDTVPSWLLVGESGSAGVAALTVLRVAGVALGWASARLLRPPRTGPSRPRR
ncbi:hypothetical protein ACQEU5_14760 [Marinactinospora thermotolerans]|uniref:hypothetical protein n=1 Tax=Marinactinospora thermotolerans TaxID=531310 RepID=UPI003D8D8C53